MYMYRCICVQHVYTSVYACVCVCVRARAYACVCMHERACMHACMYLCMYACMHVCMCVRMCAYTCVYIICRFWKPTVTDQLAAVASEPRRKWSTRRPVARAEPAAEDPDKVDLLPPS